MAKLDFTFEQSGWEAWLLRRQMGEKISAAHITADSGDATYNQTSVAALTREVFC